MHWRFWIGAALVWGPVLSGLLPAAQPAWKAGAARLKITPQEPLWMAGFASRDRPAEGQLHDLWVKILALESADGHRGVVITSDLCGISKATYESV